MNPIVLVGLGGLALIALAGKGNAATPGKPVTQAILDRMAAALATASPATIRTEAAALHALGYNAQADDLVRAAQQLEQRQAAPITATPAALLTPKATTFKRGSSGPEVSSWQTYLRTQGYSAVTVDGAFGSQTEDATKSWQSKRGLKADGIVGPETLRAATLPAPAVVMAPAPPAVVVKPAPAPAVVAAAAAVVATAWPKLVAVLGSGATGEVVRFWQGVLVLAHLLPATGIDGQFGPATIAATKAWQVAHKLTADGYVGSATWALAQKEAATVKVAGDVAFAAHSPLPGIVPPAAPRLVDVSADRSLAARLALDLSRSEQGSEDRELVGQFQRMLGLNVTGAYGPGTAKALMRYGHVPPWPFYWAAQHSTREKADYRRVLRNEAARDPQRAPEWNAAASHG